MGILDVKTETIIGRGYIRELYAYHEKRQEEQKRQETFFFLHH